MKYLLASIILAVLAVNPLLAETKAAPLNVLTDMDAAKAKSKETGKPVFLEFMSSTCPHCLAFKKKVISDPDFIDYASSNLVVVIYDYEELSKLPAEDKKKREDLMEKLKVESFPTILLIGNDGEILLRTSGYNGTPSAEIIASLKKAAE